MRTLSWQYRHDHEQPCHDQSFPYSINAAKTLRVHCIDGITANADVCRHYVEYSIGTVTALNPVIGYERATELATEAMKTGRGILELVRERKILTEEQIAKVLDPAAMTGQALR